jgi:response regulator RpfG family c-di-GMP phosphodiesterase
VHVIEQLALAAEQHFDVVGEHLWRVSALSIEIAQLLGLDHQYVGQLGEAARLHDIGKIAVPESILHKPGDLTDDEWEVMRSHTVIGAQLLAHGRTELAEMAVAIALAARIVAVADVFDALVSRRVYKDPWPIERAVAEISRKAGRWFDPQIVGAFMQVIARAGDTGAR